jgi:hypothetical protein
MEEEKGWCAQRTLRATSRIQYYNVDGYIPLNRSIMIRTIGLVIYTYNNLEDYLDPIWDWVQTIEAWYEKPFAELHFLPRNKKGGKVIEASLSNRVRLHTRLKNEKPWTLISFGYPRDILKGYLGEVSNGVVVSMLSSPKSKYGEEAYRYPSRLTIEVDPSVFRKTGKTADFITLGSQAWSITQGVYGFIDIDTGISPNDNLIRNFACVVSNLIPQEHLQEFKEWQAILPTLDKRIWKVFWGNYLSREHIQQLGGYADMRRSDWHRSQSEIIVESLEKGQELLNNSTGNLIKLPNDGYFFQLSDTPLNWTQQETQIKRRNIQEIFEPISITHYSI